MASREKFTVQTVVSANLAIMPTKFPNDSASRHIPIEYLPVTTTRYQLRIVPALQGEKIQHLDLHREFSVGKKKRHRIDLCINLLFRNPKYQQFN